ncbi:conserved hypothetical protein [Streptomyces sp. Mg1]|nr:conserved hypothetical protein [Streptomyces sp. Mg1]
MLQHDPLRRAVRDPLGFLTEGTPTDPGPSLIDPSTAMEAELVAGLVAIRDGFLLGPGEDSDGLGELAVDGQQPAGIGVGAQDVGQHHRVEVVRLRPHQGAALAVAGRGHRVDRLDRPASRT